MSTNVITNIFKVVELRKKILFTLLILVIYRIGAHIPIPGINIDALESFFSQASKGAGGGLLDFFDLFAGGAFKRFTVFALGIMPYISASIIFQLLTVVVPQVEKIAKEGPEGRKKISKYTKYLTVFLCIFQSSGIAAWLKSIPFVQGKGYIIDPNASITFYIIAVITITTGTLVLMWLGEIITERGIGNGISLIIFSGIVVGLPSATYDTIRRIVSKSEPIVGVILLIVFASVTAVSILLTLGRRNVPLQYGKRQSTTNFQGGAQHLPVPINAGNVIPIIFGVAIMQFPTQISNMLGVETSSTFAKILYWISPGQIPYMIIYAMLILFFSFFYAAIVFNPVEVSENLKKYQGFIPGIRPGSSTSEYLAALLNRVTLVGSLILAFIAIAPDIILKMWPEEVSPNMAYLFGGTSLLIVVGVALDTLKQIESQLMMRYYDGFFKKGKIQGRK